MLLAGLALALVVGAVTVVAARLLRGHPRSLATLRIGMGVTAAAVVAGSIGLLYAVSYVLTDQVPLVYAAVVMVASFLLFQWLISPFIINAAYRTRDPGPGEEWLARAVGEYAKRSGLRSVPKVKIAEVDAPNAFAYGSPFAGSYVAVTRGLLELMPREEVEAVLGHEVGHLKHKDVHVILALSFLPVAIFYIGRMLMLAGWLGAGGRNERGGGPLLLAAMGALMAAAGVAFQFMVTHFSRLREYYADAHSAAVTNNPRLLQRALTRLTLAYEQVPELSGSVSKVASMLFIVNFLIEASGGVAYDPFEYYFLPRRRAPRRVVVDIDAAVEELMRRETSPVLELFSTHPPVPKRLRFLESLRSHS